MSKKDHVDSQYHGVTRRHFLTGLTAAAGSVALQSSLQGAQPSALADTVDTPAFLGESRVPFDAEHQAGIETPIQAHVNLLGFNLKPGLTQADIIKLLQVWTEDSRRLCNGEPPLGSFEPEMAAKTANLTITAGFGESFFKKAGVQKQKPEWLHDIPAFETDRLEEEWGQTDLVIQVCADDSLSCHYATRHLIRSGKFYASLFWNQIGFGFAKGTQNRGATGRNLFGQIDGTVNPHSPEDFLQQVWIDDDKDWINGGSAMVVRRIFMHMDTWDILDRQSREIVIGRRMDNGAPLTGGEEFTPARFDAVDELGLPIIDPKSHMAQAHYPEDHPEQVLQRRAYNYDLALTPDVAQKMQREGVKVLSNTGLIFICFQKNPDLQFTPIQTRLDKNDRLNQWITHIESAVYAIPPGVGEGRDAYWGASLFV